MYPPRATDEEVQRNHDVITDFYRGLDHCVGFVIDASKVELVPATQRRIIANHLTETRPFAGRYKVGTAIVISGPVVRGMYTAILWVAPAYYPQKTSADPFRAEHWVRNGSGPFARVP